jgi:hypothetical protein
MREELAFMGMKPGVYDYLNFETGMKLQYSIERVWISSSDSHLLPLVTLMKHLSAMVTYETEK